jgi:hypothetical protein
MTKVYSVPVNLTTVSFHMLAWLSHMIVALLYLTSRANIGTNQQAVGDCKIKLTDI